MTEGIEAVTRTALAMALDAASLRQQASAANIANANTAGFVPRRVSFEAQLVDARRSLQEFGQIDAFALTQVSPRVEAAVDNPGTASLVRLDMEAADMARNAVQYQALVKGLSRHFAVLSIAVGDGRR